jgi:hypothetical protein
MPKVSGYLRIKDRDYTINNNKEHVTIDSDGKIMVTYSRATNTIEHPSTSKKYGHVPAAGSKVYNCDTFLRIDDDVKAYVGVTGEGSFAVTKTMAKAMGAIKRKILRK